MKFKTANKFYSHRSGMMQIAAIMMGIEVNLFAF